MIKMCIEEKWRDMKKVFKTVILCVPNCFGNPDFNLSNDFIVNCSFTPINSRKVFSLIPYLEILAPNGKMSASHCALGRFL